MEAITEVFTLIVSLCSYTKFNNFPQVYKSEMPLGLFQKVGKYRGIGGSGGRAPSEVQGQHPGGGSRGQSPLEARAFSQSELPRKPPIDTHGRYTYNTCTGKEEKKSERRNSDKSRKNSIPDKL